MRFPLPGLKDRHHCTLLDGEMVLLPVPAAYRLRPWRTVSRAIDLTAEAILVYAQGSSPKGSLQLGRLQISKLKSTAAFSKFIR